MSATVIASGTLTTTNVEADVYEFTNNRIAQFYIDLTNMQSGDVFVLKVYLKILSTSSYKEYIAQTFSNAQSPVLLASEPFSAPYGAKVTIQRTGGSDRQCEWRFDEL